MRGLSLALEGLAPRFASAVLASIIFIQLGMYSPKNLSPQRRKERKDRQDDIWQITMNATVTIRCRQRELRLN
jgi:hypothetical protein